MRKLFLAAFVALTVYVAAALGIACYGLIDHTGAADIIVVPGNMVRMDGTPSDRLKARLDVALSLYNRRSAPVIFVSGGIGREGHDEASVMAKYLIAHGVPIGSIVQDPLGIDTSATAFNASRYLKARSLSTAIVATQYFHVARTALALERNGVQVTGRGSPRYFELRDAYSVAREVPAYVSYWVLRKQASG